MTGFAIFVVNITLYKWPVEVYQLYYFAETDDFEDERKRFFYWILFLSSIMMFLNSLGITSKDGWRRWVYDMSVIIIAALFLAIVVYLFHKPDRNNYIKTIYQDAFTVDVWQTLKKISRVQVRQFERSHKCCGFNNVFDHCED